MADASKIIMVEGDAPATPSSGTTALYPKVDHLFYTKGSDGVEHSLIGSDGAAGADGADAYVYIAYASDASGTDFTTTFDANLDYIAVLATTTAIVSPAVGDFAGLWKNYKGADGAAGAAGADGFLLTGLTVTSTTTNFPSASIGDALVVTTSDGNPAWLGGAAGSGVVVNSGDVIICVANTAGGSYASVGTDWNLQRRLIAMPDGYRYVEIAGNTSDPTYTNGIHWLNNRPYFKLDSVIFPAVNLLSATTVTFGADGATTLFTVPAGKRCVLEKAIVIAAADAGTTTMTIGQVGALTDFLGTQTLSNLDAQYDAVILQPVPNATPVKQKSYAATTVIQADVGSHAGSAGNTVLLYGTLY